MTLITHIATRLPDPLLMRAGVGTGRVRRAVLHVALLRAQQRALTRFGATHQRLVNSLFDAHFLHSAAAPLLQVSLQPGGRACPQALARAWLDQVRGDRPAPAAPSDLTEVERGARVFLDLLTDELRPYQALREPP